MSTFTPDYQRLLAQLRRHEGAVKDSEGNHIPYRCPANRLTIGYGHNLDANPIPGIWPRTEGQAAIAAREAEQGRVPLPPRLNEDQAERLLRADVLSIQEKLAAHLPWIEALNGPRYAVLVNMAFTMGVSGLLGFQKTLAFARVGDFRNAAREMLRSKWAKKQAVKRALELSVQMETGAWQ